MAMVIMGDVHHGGFDGSDFGFSPMYMIEIVGNQVNITIVLITMINMRSIRLNGLG